jgi:hypothetical protein
MTNGKSLAKMNQRTDFALITFLVWILSFHSTSCNAFIFGVQAFQSPKTPSKINNALPFGGKSNKSFDNETVSTFQLVVVSIANKYLKGPTNDSPASIIEQLLSQMTALLLLLSSFLSQMMALRISSSFLSQRLHLKPSPQQLLQKP